MGEDGLLLRLESEAGASVLPEVGLAAEGLKPVTMDPGAMPEGAFVEGVSALRDWAWLREGPRTRITRGRKSPNIPIESN